MRDLVPGSTRAFQFIDLWSPLWRGRNFTLRPWQNGVTPPNHSQCRRKCPLSDLNLEITDTSIQACPKSVFTRATGPALSCGVSCFL